MARQQNIDVDLEEPKESGHQCIIAAGRADIGIVSGAIEPEMQLETFPFAQDVLVLITPIPFSDCAHVASLASVWTGG